MLWVIMVIWVHVARNWAEDPVICNNSCGDFKDRNYYVLEYIHLLLVEFGSSLDAASPVP